MYPERALTLAMLGALSAAAYADVPVVADGRAQAVVVTAAEPLPLARYAAEELVYHVQRATGVALTIVTEDAIPPDAPAGRIYVGATQAGAAAGIDAAALDGEETVLRTVGGSLFIVGDDRDGDPLSGDTRAGTLWGVYELLERELGVVWMWPGELGTHVPPTDRVVIGDLDERFAPWLLQRNVRAGLMSAEFRTQPFTPEGLAAYARDQSVFLRRHRMGRVHPLRYGHAFNSWWDEYGAEHPEWFQLVNGRRGPTSPGARFSMCVSNPELHNEILARWQRARVAAPGQFININICENDIHGLCECERCTSWDGPQPENINPRFGPRVVSDRYARFWKIISEAAMAIDPEAITIAYAYVNYAPAPSADIRLPRNMLIGTVPDIFFPRTDAEQQWTKQQWEGWARTGASIFLRPNYMLHGYCMPHIFVHQFADEFKFEAAHGMMATDFDSLNGQWSTQGTNLYALMRLHTRPQMDIDDLLGEYYSGFGPAADTVRAYFDYWEDYVTALRALPEYADTNSLVNWTRYAGAAHRIFPEEVLTQGMAMLERAAAQVAGQEPFAARVQFLRTGLQHAMLSARVARLVAGDDPESSPFTALRAMQELARYRREIEGSNIANLNFCAYIEMRSWQPVEGYAGEPVRPVADQVAPLPEGAHFSLRGGHTIVAALEAGESFRTHIDTRRVGANEQPILWVLVAPDDSVLARGEIPVGTSADIDVPVEAAGTYPLVVQTNQNNAKITPRNDHAAVAAPRIAFVYQTSPVWFMVPAGTQQFTLQAMGQGPGETVRVRILDPDGNQVLDREIVEAGAVPLTITVGAGQHGRAWSVVFEPAQTGVMEDYALRMDPALPAYWALAPDRLVLPAR
ncbi:MAG: DUF4838 domain-containing protein [Armatimonadota bacterium]